MARLFGAFIGALVALMGFNLLSTGQLFLQEYANSTLWGWIMLVVGVLMVLGSFFSSGQKTQPR